MSPFSPVKNGAAEDMSCMLDVLLFNCINNLEPKTANYYYKIDRQHEQRQRVYRHAPGSVFNYWTGKVITEDTGSKNWIVVDPCEVCEMARDAKG